MTTETIAATPYAPQLATAWNGFIRDSRNGTFLFDRGYMDYHADRFTDQSLCLWNGAELTAVFPASRHGDAVISHGGLTYGGLVVGDRLSGADRIYQMLEVLCSHYRAIGVTRLVYKTVPHIYHRIPSEEDRHALFRLAARLFRSDLSSAIAPGAGPRLRKGRKAMIQRARKIESLTIAPSSDWAAFHDLLSGRLDEKYGITPVHTAAEMALLAERFPDAIRLTACCLSGVMIAGCLSFDTGTVIHTQYLATNAEARDNGGLDLLLDSLIEDAAAKGKWFDFGISTTEGGRRLNASLIDYKESFGARGIVYDHYELDL